MRAARKVDPRDALTGEALDPDALHLHWDIPAHKRRPKDRTDPGWDLIIAPVTLHTRHGTADQRVGLAYSRLLEAYLDASEQTTRDEHWREDRLWWTTNYGVRIVWHRLLERHSTEIARRILLAVMTMHREECDPSVIAARFERTTRWVYQQFYECNYLANSPTMRKR